MSTNPQIQKLQQWLSALDKELSKVQYLVTFETVTKVPKTYAVLGGVALFSLMVLLNLWGSLLTDLLGFVYPAYMSFKAIESKGKDDDTQWLTYWVVFGFMNVIEFFSDLL